MTLCVISRDGRFFQTTAEAIYYYTFKTPRKKNNCRIKAECVKFVRTKHGRLGGQRPNKIKKKKKRRHRLVILCCGRDVRELPRVVIRCYKRDKSKSRLRDSKRAYIQCCSAFGKTPPPPSAGERDHVIITRERDECVCVCVCVCAL